MVRILRSTLMVRVGGGWTALDEFLVKNDPCRGKFAWSTEILLPPENFHLNDKYNNSCDDHVRDSGIIWKCYTLLLMLEF